MGQRPTRTLGPSGTRRPHRPTCALRRPVGDHLRSVVLDVGGAGATAALLGAGAIGWQVVAGWVALIWLVGRAVVTSSHLVSGRPDLELRSDGLARLGPGALVVPWRHVRRVALIPAHRVGPWTRRGRVRLDVGRRRRVVLVEGYDGLGVDALGSLVVCWGERAPR
ncbi:MAG: hypothetical protein ABL966_00275 [Acidimicrobiales bacterium]